MLEKKGDFLLEAESGTTCPTPHIYLSEHHTLAEEQVWLSHFCLGHPPFLLLKKIFPNMFEKLNVQNFQCDVYEYAKHHRVSFPLSNKKKFVPFSLIHTDVWGPIKVQSISRVSQFVLFIDDCTRFTWVYLMKQKSKVNIIFPIFHNILKNQFDAKVLGIRSDNGKECFNQYLIPYLQKEGIIYYSSCNDTPQQNGIAKPKNRHLLEITRALFFQINVPKSFWGEVVLTTTYLINRLPSQILNYSSPIETLSRFFPKFEDFNHLSLRIIGCVVFVHIHARQRTKLDPRAPKCIFVGYSPTKKGL